MKPGKLGTHPQFVLISQNHDAIRFKINLKRFQWWENAENGILQSLTEFRQVAGIAKPNWHEMESELYLRSKSVQNLGRSVNHK